MKRLKLTKLITCSQHSISKSANEANILHSASQACTHYPEAVPIQSGCGISSLGMPPGQSFKLGIKNLCSWLLLHVLKWCDHMRLSVSPCVTHFCMLRAGRSQIYESSSRKLSDGVPWSAFGPGVALAHWLVESVAIWLTINWFALKKKHKVKGPWAGEAAEFEEHATPGRLQCWAPFFSCMYLHVNDLKGNTFSQPLVRKNVTPCVVLHL